MHITITFRTTSDFEGTLGLNVRKSYTTNNQTSITMRKNELETTTILVNRTKSAFNSTTNFEFPEDTSVNTTYNFSENVFTLDVIIDRSSIETFFFGGLYSITNLVLGNKDDNGIEVVISDESKAWVDSLYVHMLSKAVPFK
jgi:sucrose-6-phosphate hydrolase SacC (GH32 family)